MSSRLLCVAVAGRRGADTFQKHTWTELPAETTLRAVGRFICPDGELLHVEARKDIGGELSEFAGGMLDQTLPSLSVWLGCNSSSAALLWTRLSSQEASAGARWW